MTFTSKTVQRMQYFVGKVCSVFTPQINREFDELRSREHFVIQVQEVTTDGIWGTHPHRKTLSFFPMHAVLLVQEEQVLDPSNPEHKIMIEEFEQKTGKKVASDIGPHIIPTKEAPKEASLSGSFVNIDQLSAMAKETKRNYAVYDINKEKLSK